jgi:glutamate synthase (NADPH/NADH) small chain
MLRQTHAHEEGGETFWSVMTKEFSGEDGIIKKLLCAEVEWVAPEEGKPPVPVEKAGTDFELEADMVLLAMGFLGPGKNRLIDEMGIELDSRGNVKADERRMTNIEGLFVAGDMTIGQSLVVRAIGDGRKAAHGIMAYLKKGR